MNNSYASLDVNVDDPDLVVRLVALVRPDVLNVVNHFKASGGPTKDAVADRMHRTSAHPGYSEPNRAARLVRNPPMLVVQPRARHGRNEELTAVRLRARVGHRQRVRSVVLERRVKLVLERLAPQRLAARAVSEGIASL